MSGVVTYIILRLSVIVNGKVRFKRTLPTVNSGLLRRIAEKETDPYAANIEVCRTLYPVLLFIFQGRTSPYRFGPAGNRPRLCRPGCHLFGERLLNGITCFLRTRRVHPCGWNPKQAVLAHGRMGEGHSLEVERADSKEQVDGIAVFWRHGQHLLSVNRGMEYRQAKFTAYCNEIQEEEEKHWPRQLHSERR